MKIYFKLIYHLSYSESKNLCTWERERTEEFLLQKVKVRTDWGWEWKMAGWEDGWPSVPFPYPTTYTLIHGCVKGGWSKSGGPRHPEFMLWAFVCVTMHICKCMQTCTCVTVCVAHMHKYVSVCVHMYIYLGAPHKYPYPLNVMSLKVQLLNWDCFDNSSQWYTW